MKELLITSIFLLLTSSPCTHAMKRPAQEQSGQSPAAQNQALQQTQQQPAAAQSQAPAIAEVFGQTYLPNYIASFLPPADFCCFAQVSKTTHEACMLKADEADYSPLEYQKMAQYLIDNYSNPVIRF